MTAMQALHTQSRSRRRTHAGRRSVNTTRRDASGRFTSRPRRVRRAARTTRRSLNLPQRDARGRFRSRASPVSFVEVSMRPPPPARRIVKRRWWRVDGPQDPNLPKGYTYET